MQDNSNRKQRRAAKKIGAQAALQGTLPPAGLLFIQAVQKHQVGQVAEAEDIYRRLLAIDQEHAEGWSNLGLALRTRGALGEAIESYKRAIAVRPHYLQPYLNLIDTMQAAGRVSDAVHFSDRSILLEPNIPEVHNNTGVILQESGHPERAEQYYRRAIELRPNFADAWSNLGQAMSEMRRPEEAIAACLQAIAHKPDYAEAYSNLGGAYRSIGRHEDAIAAYRQAVAKKSTFAGAFSNLGMALLDLGMIDEAVDACRNSVRLKLGDAEALCNFGTALQKQNSLAEAVHAYRLSIALKPGYASPYSNLGMGYHEQNKFDEAIVTLGHAIRLRPNYAEAISEYIQMRRHVCDWSDFEGDLKWLHELIEKDEPVASFIVLASSSTATEQLKSARQSMKRLQVPSHPPFIHDRQRPRDKVKIAYLSIDFRDHPVGRLLPDMFERHDRSKIHVSAYSYCPEDSGPLRQRLKQSCDNFVDIRLLSHRDAADLIYRDQIDILIDLTGRTLGARTEIMALRPAPTLVSFLGFPGTMGADFNDYIIADPFLVPFDQQPFYTEQIVHLPDCYQPSDLRRTLASPLPSRADCGLPEKGFVFCSFNNTYKITPSVFTSWMSILRQTPGSVLWLYCKTPQTIGTLRRIAESQGVAPDRIVFTGFAQMDLYLARMHIADLFLDSAPYNAGATCNDALWAGLPVLTIVGDTYVGRMAGSMLRAIGLPELATTSLADYEALAVQLANDPARHGALRARLAANRHTMPLFDMTRYTKNLDKAFITMSERWRAGESPAPFAVTP